MITTMAIRRPKQAGRPDHSTEKSWRSFAGTTITELRISALLGVVSSVRREVSPTSAFSDHAARARERVCVRLINQTFAFGILAREKEEELEIAEEEMATGQGERTKRRTRRRCCRPGRIEHEARAGPSRTGQQPCLCFCLEPGSRGYREFYNDTTERARSGEHGKPSRDAGGYDHGKVKKIRAKATAERLLPHPPPSSPPSCRLSRDSAGLIRSRGGGEAESGDVVFVGVEGRQRRGSHLGFQQQERQGETAGASDPLKIAGCVTPARRAKYQPAVVPLRAAPQSVPVDSKKVRRGRLNSRRKLRRCFLTQPPPLLFRRYSVSNEEERSKEGIRIPYTRASENAPRESRRERKRGAEGSEEGCTGEERRWDTPRAERGRGRREARWMLKRGRASGILASTGGTCEIKRDREPEREQDRTRKARNHVARRRDEDGRVASGTWRERRRTSGKGTRIEPDKVAMGAGVSEKEGDSCDTEGRRGQAGDKGPPGTGGETERGKKNEENECAGCLGGRDIEAEGSQRGQRKLTLEMRELPRVCGVRNFLVQTSVAVQQGQQWCITWLAQLRQFILQLCNEQHAQYVKDTALQMAGSVQRGWQEVQFQYYNTQWNSIDFYHQLRILCANKVSRREAIFCLTGIVIGTVTGYYVGVNWKPTSQHIHHIKTIACHHYYGIEGVLLIDDSEMPTIKRSNELLIQVKAASLNVVDTKICSGYSRIYRRLLNSGKQKELPVTLGRDCAGVIVDIGQSVVNFDIGDEVFLAVPSWASGTMAEYIIVPETQVAKRPKSCNFEASASLPYNGCLAWDALVNRSVIKEGNAKGKRVLIFGGSTPIGCILMQLIKLWGGYVVTACRTDAMPIMKALGADEVIVINETDVEKELQLHDKYDAIFYTDNQPFQEYILKKHLLPHGSYVSTVPEQLTSDSLGFICGSIFAGCVRIKLLVQYMFGFNMHQWKEGAKLNIAYLRALCELTDTHHLQTVVDRVYAPYNIERALLHVLDPNSIGSTIITFQ
ncbi:Reticulon-4-interacting protein 1, mitochondrial [Cyphomyrmex costatus]|uniref:Reticulon-4-interacting protein 1, mitochondrial n=1 Tax=Cyphomyrmex costatus TaxID=456900 RepID=A0A151IMU6_9HYME|nr:Reticulon-4-interacting protein 1, mitochondrial [Cyphomyrmex costatus]